MPTLYKRGKTYWIDYTAGGKRVQRSLKTTQRKVAEEALKTIEGDLVRQDHGIPLKGAGVAKALEDFRADRGTKASEAWVKVQEARIRAFLEATGARRLDDITPPRLEKYLRARQADHGVVRARDDFKILRTFLRFCVRMGLLTQNPIAKVEPPPPPPRKPIHFVSREEAARLLEACEAPVELHGPGGKGNGTTRERRTPLAVMAHVALYAGLRAGEIVALRWQDVDFGKGILHVRVRDEWSPKDGESRKIPLHDKLRAALEAHRDREESAKPVEYVFRTGNATPYGVAFLHHELVKVAQRAGIKANWYTLRHTFASWLAQDGVSLHVIARFLGHASVTTTERHYAALVPEDLGHVIARL